MDGETPISPWCGEHTPVGGWDTLVDKIAPKTQHLPFVRLPVKESRGPRLPGEELPTTPKPGKKEGDAGGDGPTETPPLCSHSLIPEAAKASGT